MPVVGLYDAKTHLSSLVERAARGEEFVITKNGVPRARISAVTFSKSERLPVNAMRITYVADDFDMLDPRIAVLFGGQPW